MTRQASRVVLALVVLVVGMLVPARGASAATVASSIEDNGANGCSVGSGGQGSTYCFLPEITRVLGGDTVTWTDNSSAPGHTITRCTVAACPPVGPGSGSALDMFNSGTLSHGATFSHTFNGGGTYNYYCSIHGYSAMHGSVVQGSLAPGDFDGDGRTDLTVFRPTTNQWFTSYSSGMTYTATVWGQNGDIPVPADYDGTGRSQIAIFRPSTGTWYVLHGGGGYAATVWGQSGDIPVPADYDNAGRAQLAVYRPSTGTWYDLHGDGSYTATVWGQPGGSDVPVPADYDGKSRSQIAVYRPANGTWYILHGDGSYTATVWGQPGSSDVPVPADYDGTRHAQITAYRPGTGEWFVLHAGGGYSDTIWGQSGDLPQPGDYNGDGNSDLTVYRPSTGTWFVLPSGGGAYVSTQWGTSGDEPTVLPYAISQAITSCPTHSNGLGQTYQDCNPLGSPGVQASYNSTMAHEAAAAWPPSGTVSSATCGTAQAVTKTAASSAATWVYTGTLSGHVFLNNSGATPLCPAASDPTWN